MCTRSEAVRVVPTPSPGPCAVLRARYSMRRCHRPTAAYCCRRTMSVVPMPAWPLERKPRSSSPCRARLVPARTARYLLHPSACSCVGLARAGDVSPSPATSCPPAPGAPRAASVACSPIMSNMAMLTVVRCMSRCLYILARLCFIGSGHCIAGYGSARPPPA